jgi:hypothetical protein
MYMFVYDPLFWQLHFIDTSPKHSNWILSIYNKFKNFSRKAIHFSKTRMFRINVSPDQTET